MVTADGSHDEIGNNSQKWLRKTDHYMLCTWCTGVQRNLMIAAASDERPTIA